MNTDPASASASMQASKIATVLFHTFFNAIPKQVVSLAQKTFEIFYLKDIESEDSWDQAELDQLEREFLSDVDEEQIGVPQSLKEWISLEALRGLPLPIQRIIINRPYDLAQLMRIGVPFEALSSLEQGMLTNILNHMHESRPLILDTLSKSVESIDASFIQLSPETWIHILTAANASISNMSKGSVSLREVQQLMQEHIQIEGASERPP